MSPTRFRASLASFSIAIALTALAGRARAQVSDADRAAARELYVAGVRGQDAGHFAEALEKFQRAQSVFSAPTHLLHIAECQAALGRLVESAETYRTLVRTPLPPGAPNVFVQAQQQGNAELPQVEPRIPSVRLTVRPENLPGLQVKVDGQPMSAALVGVQRPINPGQHTISVQAQGYARVDQPIAVKEKETKEVTVTLKEQPGGAGGIIYTPAPAGPATAQPPANNPGSEAPPPYDRSTPPPYDAPPEHKTAAGGFMIGPRLGVLLPGGSLAKNVNQNQLVGAGLSLGGEAGFRFARRWYIGGVFEHGFHQKGDSIDNLGGAVSVGDALNSTETSNYYGLNFIYISNPDGLGFYGELGLGYRTLNLDYATQQSDASSSFSGGEGEIALGMHIKAGEWVRMIPKIGFSAGTYSKGTCDQTGTTVPTGLGCSDVGVNNGTFANTDSHSFVFIGVTAFIDFARKH